MSKIKIHKVDLHSRGHGTALCGVRVKWHSKTFGMWKGTAKFNGTHKDAEVTCIECQKRLEKNNA